MFASRRRLRIRLALEFMIIAAAANALLFLIVIAIREDQTRSRFDRELIQRAREIGAQVSTELARTGRFPLEGFDLGTAYAFEVFGDAGELLGETRTYSELDLRALVEVGRDERRGQARLTTSRQGAADQGPLRIATVTLPGADDRRAVTVHAARSLAPLNAASANAWAMLFLVVLPLVTLAGGLSGLLISDRVLRRIAQITRAAHNIHAGDLGQRLKIPDPGDEIGEMVREMNGMISRLEAAFGAQRKFILDVTHELKTPVSIMLSQAQLLARKSPVTDSEQYEEFVVSVEEEMRRLGQLLESFLTLARSAHGTTYVAESLVSLNEAAAEAGERWEHVGRSFGSRVSMTLHYSEDSATDAIVRGDHELLVTMIENLLTAVSDIAGPKRLLNLLVERQDDAAIVIVNALDIETGTPVPPRPLNQRGHELRMAIVHGVAQLHAGHVISRGAHVAIQLPLVQKSTREQVRA